MFKSQKIAKLIGTNYERKAEKFLLKNGLKPIAKNYTCRFGEIDLIMTQNQTLVFVEVRGRSNQNYGTTLETVDLKKQSKIIITAKFYLSKNQNLDYDAVRFDVIGISKKISWVQNAFTIDK